VLVLHWPVALVALRLRLWLVPMLADRVTDRATRAASVYFPVPFSIGLATTIQVGNLLGEVRAGRFHLGIGPYRLRFTYVTPVLVTIHSKC
jgi:hypothetical protein